MKVTNFDLDEVLLKLNSDQEISEWTTRNAVEGLQIFGGIGSGKTSGSGRLIALKYLSNGFGGLVLTAKADEKKLWEEYCRIAKRSDDLIVIEPGGKHFFNFLEYESSNEMGGISNTENTVQVLKTVIRASEEKSGGKSDDPFWETALDMLIFNTIDLCQLAYGKVTVELLYNIVLTAPKKDHSKEDKKKPGSFSDAFELAQKNINSQVKRLEASLTPEEKKNWVNSDFIEWYILEKLPDARLLKSLDQFFIEHYRNLSEKTRSIIEFSFSGFLFHLLKEPINSLFCRYSSTFNPEDSLNGKIILLNLPVKTHFKVGRDAQVMFKYIWQRAMERRDIEKNNRPVFLWADEAQHFLHEYDAEYQATARSSRIATVYISQNLHNYHANMGGIKSEFRVKSFLGTLSTKIFHANADIETNRYGSELIGEGYSEDISNSVTMAGDFSSTQAVSYKLERMVRPEQFVSLKTGAKDNDYCIEAFIHRQGKPFHDEMNFKKIIFKQQ